MFGFKELFISAHMSAIRIDFFPWARFCGFIAGEFAIVSEDRIISHDDNVGFHIAICKLPCTISLSHCRTGKRQGNCKDHQKTKESITHLSLLLKDKIDVTYL